MHPDEVPGQRSLIPPVTPVLEFITQALNNSFLPAHPQIERDTKDHLQEKTNQPDPNHHRPWTGKEIAIDKES
jgi:hypothetical protein